MFINLRFSKIIFQNDIQLQIFGSEIKNFGNRKLPAKFVMIPMDKKGNQTILKMDKMIFDKDIPESFFSQQNMKRIR